jgi:hypothetical protein
MSGIHDALDHWKVRVFRLPVDQYPIVWAGHFSGSVSLGSFGVGVLPEGDVAKVVHAVAFPFALSPTVEATYVVIDEEAVFGPKRRKLLVGRLLALSSGVSVTHWEVRFGITDNGGIYLGRPVQEMPRRELSATFTELMNQRLALADSPGFGEAWTQSMARMREWTP